MNWGSVSEFIAMGGHGSYIWGAYGVTALFMLVEVIFLITQKKSLVKRLKRISRMNQP